jgi:hypothetical protein
MTVVIHLFKATKTYYGNKFWREHQHQTQGPNAVLTNNAYQPELSPYLLLLT